MRKSHYLAVTAAAAGVMGIGGFGAATSIAATGPAALVAKAAPALKLPKVAVKSGSATVKTSVLVDAKGRAIYLLTGDRVTHPGCTSKGCLGAWPAVTSTDAKPTLGPGVKATTSAFYDHAACDDPVDSGAE